MKEVYIKHKDMFSKESNVKVKSFDNREILLLNPKRSDNVLKIELSYQKNDIKVSVADIRTLTYQYDEEEVLYNMIMFLYNEYGDILNKVNNLVNMFINNELYDNALINTVSNRLSNK